MEAVIIYFWSEEVFYWNTLETSYNALINMHKSFL